MTPHRCRSCRRRRALKKPITWYIRAPKCRHCGGELVIDNHRADKREIDRNVVCHCDGLWFPHRPRSVDFCKDNHARGAQRIRDKNAARRAPVASV